MNKSICAIVLLLCGCEPSIREPEGAKDFFNMSKASQKEDFKSRSLDGQYELYLFGMGVVHPPAMYLAEPFAQQGSEVVPFLTSKVKTAEDEFTIYAIVFVFSEMARQGQYDFSKDPQLVGVLETRVERMHGIWRESTLEMLRDIKERRNGEGLTSRKLESE